MSNNNDLSNIVLSDCTSISNTSDLVPSHQNELWTITSTSTCPTTTTVGDVVYNTISNGILVSDSSGWYSWDANTINEIDELRKEKELRKKNPALMEAWKQYQLVKKLVQDEECNKYSTRYGKFKV